MKKNPTVGSCSVALNCRGSRVPKPKDTKTHDFGHFRSSEQHVGQGWHFRPNVVTYSVPPLCQRVQHMTLTLTLSLTLTKTITLTLLTPTILALTLFERLAENFHHRSIRKVGYDFQRLVTLRQSRQNCSRVIKPLKLVKVRKKT